MSDQLFKKIEDPKSVRKQILESSKDVIKNLKEYHEIIMIRKEKEELMDSLKMDIQEINVLFDKLKDSFPVEIVNQYKEENKPKKGKKKGKKGSKKKSSQKTKVTELAKLESKLSDIENKLKGL